MLVRPTLPSDGDWRARATSAGVDLAAALAVEHPLPVGQWPIVGGLAGDQIASRTSDALECQLQLANFGSMRRKRPSSATLFSLWRAPRRPDAGRVRSGFTGAPSARVKLASRSTGRARRRPPHCGGHKCIVLI